MLTEDSLPGHLNLAKIVPNAMRNANLVFSSLAMNANRCAHKGSKRTEKTAIEMK
jgi:hypothetical protein